MNVNEIKVLRKEVPFSSMVSMIQIAVDNSFGVVSKKYHKYLHDYAETLCVLMLYTDYTVDTPNGDSEGVESNSNFDEIMSIRFSNKWVEIISEIGYQYDVMSQYIQDEINQEIKPLAKMDALIASLSKIVDKAYNVLEAIDTEAIKNVDASALKDMLEAFAVSSEANNTVQPTTQVMQEA